MKLIAVFFLVMGLVIGVCGTMALHINRVGPEPGDWLAFAGALIGVVLTIGGTLWLESYRASRGEREGVEIIQTTLREIAKCLDAANTAREDEAIMTFRPKQIAAEISLAKSFERFLYARHYVPKRNIIAWQAMEELQLLLSKERELVEKEASIIENAGDNENVLGVNLSKMFDVRSRLAPYIASAEKTLS